MGHALQQGNRWVRRSLGPALAAPATIWLMVAFAAPFLIVVLLAMQPESDPFAPLTFVPSAAQFRAILSDEFYFSVLWKTTVLAIVVAAITTVLAYPLTLWILSLPPRWRPLAISAVLVPLLINVVVR
jgi:putative spermidine/putrescine transport system permease protein